MSIFVIGINHKTAPISIREKVFFASEQYAIYLHDLLSYPGVREAVLLSTCNRSELYGEADDVEVLREWFCAQTTLTNKVLEPLLYIYKQEEAITHMMQVACGLDSMILGESQIFGQMKEAFSESCSAGGVGTTFHHLFQQIFMMAKEIRTTTSIGACPVSVASAAIHFAKHHTDHFSQANIVLLGAGQVSELLIRYLKNYLQQPLTLVNRHIEKGLTVLGEVPGQVVDLKQLSQVLLHADIVFSATGSATPIITKNLLSEVMPYRRKQLILIDIAVPRDVEPAIAELASVKLYCVDDLKSTIETNRQGREHAAAKVHEMIQTKSVECLMSLKSIDNVKHTIQAYRSQIEEICQVELHKAKQQLQRGIDSTIVLDEFARVFINKLLHHPSVQLRQAGEEGRFELLHFAKRLFAISD